MADFRLSRREFLIGGASTLVAPELARAFKPGPSFHQQQKGWINVNITNSLGARSAGPSKTFGNYIFYFGGAATSSSWPATCAWFDPANNSWQGITPTTGTTPAGRTNSYIASNSTSLFLFGGTGSGGRLNSGGLYTPTAAGANGGTWVATTTTNAPSAREFHTSVWCNNKYIVWGGRNGSTYYNDGAIWDPGTNTWTTIPAPSNVTISGRATHSTVATSDGKMIIFGGYNGSVIEDGFVYNAVTGTWSAMAPSPYVGGGFGYNLGHCYTGTQMFVWGGGTAVAAFYTPSSDTWQVVNGTGTPLGGGGGQAYWTGTKIIVADQQTVCGIYTPATDSWTAIPMTNGPTTGTTLYMLGYANKRLVYWGGTVVSTRQNKGFMYWHPAYL